MAPYDWRLSFWNLEERDGYFSKLRNTIEGLKCGCPPETRVTFLTPSPQYRKRQKKKTVLAAHSMGSTVCHEPISMFPQYTDHYLRLRWLISFLRAPSNIIISNCASGQSVLVSFLVSSLPAAALTDCPSFKWVESPEHGGGGPNWVEVRFRGQPRQTSYQLTTVSTQNHIESFISVAGTHLVRYN